MPNDDQHRQIDPSEAHQPFADPIAHAPYCTADMPGIGGFIKHHYEDFLVEEIPSYAPCSEGEHSYLFVEKRGLATSEMVAVIAEHFGVDESAVGCAGLKDKYAITRQQVSIHTPGKKVEDFPMLQHKKIAVLWADMHTNKLRRGHLKGNRFSIKVRGVHSTSVVRAQPILMKMAQTGVPNFYGEQRFGTRHNNHELARLDMLGLHEQAVEVLLRADERFPHVNAPVYEAYAGGDLQRALDLTHPGQAMERKVLSALVKGQPTDRAWRRIPLGQRRFLLSAFQSGMFNEVVARRLEHGSLNTLLEGDLAQQHHNNALFPVSADTLADEQDDLARRLASYEISPSGPMWGPDMPQAQGKPGSIEREALAHAGVTLEDIARYDKLLRTRMTGTRRPLRAPLIDPEIDAGVDEHGHYVRCAFELPKGSFATVVMREIIKDGQREQPGTLFHSASKEHTSNTNQDAHSGDDH